MTLTDDQRYLAVHCLRVAANRFDGDAKNIRLGLPHVSRGGSRGLISLVEQFERQAKEARELALYIEEAE